MPSSEPAISVGIDGSLASDVALDWAIDKAMLLGSVSTQVSAHAQCPVLVVPPRMRATAGMTDKVVLGVDGSAGSLVAVEVAFEEAARRAVPLIVVLAWDNGLPTATEWPLRGGTAELADRLLPWREKFPEVIAEERLFHAAPAPTLLNLVSPAGPLVVGSRGRGGFRGMSLGSVSQAMLHHAPCPVLIVRQHEAAHSDDGDRT